MSPRGSGIVEIQKLMSEQEAARMQQNNNQITANVANSPIHQQTMMMQNNMRMFNNNNNTYNNVDINNMLWPAHFREIYEIDGEQLTVRSETDLELEYPPAEYSWWAKEEWFVQKMRAMQRKNCTVWEMDRMFCKMRELWWVLSKPAANPRYKQRKDKGQGGYLTFSKFFEPYRKGYDILKRWALIQSNSLGDSPSTDSQNRLSNAAVFEQVQNLAKYKSLSFKNDNDLPARKWIPTTDSNKTSEDIPKIRTMTWNMQAQCFVDQFAFQHIVVLDKPDFLYWAMRSTLVIEEICRHMPDVVALQEMDLEHRQSLIDRLNKRCAELAGEESKSNISESNTYTEVAFQIRKRDTGRDGLFMLYRKKTNDEKGKLQVIGYLHQSLMVQPGSMAGHGGLMQRAAFRWTSLDPALSDLTFDFLVVNTHVQGNFPALETERAIELKDGSQHMMWPPEQLHNRIFDSQLVTPLLNGVWDDRESLPKLVMGDFNGFTESASKEFFQYASVYEHQHAMEAQEPGGGIVTCHNDMYHECGELDRIMYKKGEFDLQGFSQIFEHPMLKSTRTFEHPKESLPNNKWPSDHVSLVADFTWPSAITSVKEKQKMQKQQKFKLTNRKKVNKLADSSLSASVDSPENTKEGDKEYTANSHDEQHLQERTIQTHASPTIPPTSQTETGINLHSQMESCTNNMMMPESTLMSAGASKMTLMSQQSSSGSMLPKSGPMMSAAAFSAGLTPPGNNQMMTTNAEATWPSSSNFSPNTGPIRGSSVDRETHTEHSFQARHGGNNKSSNKREQPSEVTQDMEDPTSYSYSDNRRGTL